MKTLAVGVGGAFAALGGLILAALMLVSTSAAAISCGPIEDVDLEQLPQAGEVVRPLPKGVGVVTSEFTLTRKHPLTGVVKPHTGTDFGAPQGSRILAAADGIVAVAERQPAWGNIVIIDHAFADSRVSTAYAHIQDGGFKVRPGQKVLAGQHIAGVGSTGYSTGTHLHFEVRLNGSYGTPINPRPWLESNGALELTDIAEGTAEECPDPDENTDNGSEEEPPDPSALLVRER